VRLWSTQPRRRHAARPLRDSRGDRQGRGPSVGAPRQADRAGTASKPRLARSGASDTSSLGRSGPGSISATHFSSWTTQSHAHHRWHPPARVYDLTSRLSMCDRRHLTPRRETGSWCRLVRGMGIQRAITVRVDNPHGSSDVRRPGTRRPLSSASHHDRAPS